MRGFSISFLSNIWVIIRMKLESTLVAKANQHFRNCSNFGYECGSVLKIKWILEIEFQERHNRLILFRTEPCCQGLSHVVINWDYPFLKPLVISNGFEPGFDIPQSLCILPLSKIYNNFRYKSDITTSKSLLPHKSH